MGQKNEENLKDGNAKEKKIKSLFPLFLGLFLFGLVFFLIKGKGKNAAPKKTIKSFFSAVNKGDFDQAENYLSEQSVGKFFKRSEFLELTDWSLTENEGLSTLVGGIGNVEVEMKKISDPNFAVADVKVNFKQSLKDKAEKLAEDGNPKDILKSSFLKGVFTNFDKEVNFELEKQGNQWVIIYP